MDLFDSQHFQAGKGPTDINDGIDAADFMQVHLVDSGIMNGGLGLADPGEDTDSGFLDRIR